MRIGLVVDDDISSDNGVQQVVRALASEYVRYGHEVVIFCADGGLPSSGEFETHFLARTLRFKFNGNRVNVAAVPLKCSAEVRARIRACDVLNVQAPYGPMVGHRVVLQAAPSSQVVASFHMAPKNYLVVLLTRLLSVLLKSSIRRIDAVTCDSSVSMTLMQRTWRASGVLVPNPTLPVPSLPPPAEGGAFEVCFVGRLVERKGCSYFLKAIAAVPRSVRKDWVVTIAGAGPLRPKLEVLAHNLGLGRSVRFLGRVSEIEKHQLLRDADLVVLPATGGESFGMVLLEAAAAGSPILAFANPGYAFVLGESNAGLVAVGDTRALALRIEHYAKHPDALERLTMAQRSALERFDIDRIVQRYLEVFTAA